FATLRRAHHARLADAERREVVMEHERFFALAAERIDDLGVTTRTVRRHDQRLRFTARKQRRAVRTREYVRANRDRTDRFHVAPVDAGLACKDASTDDVVLEVAERLCDVIGSEGRAFAGKGCDRTLANFLNSIAASQLFGDLVRVVDSGFYYRSQRRFELRVGLGRFPIIVSLDRLSFKLDDGSNHALHLFMPEDDGAEQNVLRQRLRL